LTGTNATGAKHRQRFKKWQNLLPRQTRYLSSMVDGRLVPALESMGFQRVDVSLHDPEMPVPGKEIELERVIGELLDSISFNFEKYGSPRFQVHCARRQLETNEFVRSCNLVARSKQYYHFWGKPWWLPTRWWLDSASQRAVTSVETRLVQLISFLERGEIGANISNQDTKVRVDKNAA
jgi:hypothetical protein